MIQASSLGFRVQGSGFRGVAVKDLNLSCDGYIANKRISLLCSTQARFLNGNPVGGYMTTYDSSFNFCVFFSGGGGGGVCTVDGAYLAPPRYLSCGSS